MEQYILQESEQPNKWVLTDQTNNIVVVWENKRFNDTQVFTALENINKSPQELAKIARLMGDYLVIESPH